MSMSAHAHISTVEVNTLERKKKQSSSQRHNDSSTLTAAGNFILEKASINLQMTAGTSVTDRPVLMQMAECTC